MTGVLVLLAGSIAVGWSGHRVLAWLTACRVDPTVLLTGWVLSCLGLVVSVVTMTALQALPTDEHPSSGLLRLAGGCWTALSSGSVPAWREAVAAISVLATLVIGVRLCGAVGVRLRARRDQAPHLEQLRLLAVGSAPDEPLWVRDDRPLAVSIGGRPGLIVLSDTLRDRLPPAAVAATIEHERAHLRGRHHVLVAIVEVLARALPVCPLLRCAPPAVKDLAELAADAQAARRCGPAAVREALSTLTGHPLPLHGLGMAGRLTEDRLLRLASDVPGRRRLVRAAGCAAIAVAALALPATTGWLFLAVVGCVVT